MQRQSKSELPKKPEKHYEPTMIENMIAKAPKPKSKPDTKQGNIFVNKLQALAEANEKMKEMQQECLIKAREEAEKKFGLAEYQPTEHYLLKVNVALQSQLPDKEPTIKRRKLRDVQQFFKSGVKKFRIQDISLQNVIHTLIKGKQKKDKQKRKHKAKYKIVSSKRRRSSTSVGSFSVDSDLELDIESLTNVINGKKVYSKILHTRVVRNTPESKPIPTNEPILFHAEHADKSSPINVIDLEQEKELEVPETPGIMRYTLSDRSFITKGWTILPTEKVMRKMNIYRVRPANPEFDWFNNNRKKGSLSYDTGEKLATFDEDGRGRLFYKNGKLALDYYDCEEANAQHRFVIYSSGESSESCRNLSVSILAMFDYLGSGVVFDHGGKIRIKYNQTEGVVLDRGLGPKNRWKWHTLNDPPVLKQVMIDTRLENPDPVILQLEDDKNKLRPVDQEMIQIELDNFIKEKTKKLNQNFQPFQIKMKALKINDQFSLRILDQAHIYLHFKDGNTHLRMNLGMILDHQEIIDTETSDYNDLENGIESSLERAFPKSDSLLELQAKLKQTRYMEAKRTAYDERIRPKIPMCSADRLISAVSKPLRPVIGTCPNQTSELTNMKKRKPALCNVYYATSLI